MPKVRRFTPILLVASIAILVYSGSFRNGFVYDDHSFIVENKALRALDPESVASFFTDRDTASSDEGLSRDVWRPLVTTSFAVDFSLWGLDPAPYHAENAVLHALNAALVYLLTALLLAENAAIAFIAALVFAVHPVQTEAVAWISGRSNVLFLFFFLIALLAHIRSRRAHGDEARPAVPLAFFALSLLSKEMAITLPLVLILCDIFYFPRKGARGYLGYYLPFFVTALAYCAARYSALGVFAQKSEWWGGGILATGLVTLRAVADYIRLLFFPVNLRVDYYIATTPPVLDGHSMLAALILSAIVSAAVIFRRNNRFLFYAAFFFLTLLPVYNIVPFKAVMAERFLYLPMIAFASLFGIAAVSLYDRCRGKAALRALTGATVIAVLLWYGAATVTRIGEWADEVTFYTQEALRSPENPKAHYGFALACVREAERCRADRNRAAAYYAIAIDELKKTLTLKTDSQVAYAALGNVYIAVGQYGPAIESLRRALAIKEHSDVYNNLAVAYSRSGMPDKAIASCRRAIALAPRNANAWTNLGSAYYMKGDYAKAGRAWREAVRCGGETAAVRARLDELERRGQ